MMTHARHLLVLLLPCLTSSAIADDVYDNFSVPEFFGFWGGQTAEQRLAQQFLLGDNDAVTSVTLQLTRRGFPAGPLDVELWNDSGSGTPGAPIATLGSIADASLVPADFMPFSFTSGVSGLTPNEPYYVVLSFLEASGSFSNHVAWMAVPDETGTHGAENAQVTAIGTGDWTSILDLPGAPPIDHLHFRMSVTAVPEPSTVALVTLLAAIVLVPAVRRTWVLAPRAE